MLSNVSVQAMVLDNQALFGKWMVGKKDFSNVYIVSFTSQYHSLDIET